MTELRKTQVKSQLALERATETITSKLVESMTGPEATKNADIKSAADLVSIPSNGSIQFLQRRFQVIVEQGVGRSKKTVMVKRWLRGWGAYFLTLFN